MAVFDVENEAYVGQGFIATPVMDRMQDQHIQRRQARNTGGRNATNHPPLESVAREDEPELQLGKRRHGACREMRGRDLHARLLAQEIDLGFGVGPLSDPAVLNRPL